LFILGAYYRDKKVVGVFIAFFVPLPLVSLGVLMQ
jgi:hypothetical protein